MNLGPRLRRAEAALEGLFPAPTCETCGGITGDSPGCLVLDPLTPGGEELFGGVLVQRDFSSCGECGFPLNEAGRAVGVLGHGGTPQPGTIIELYADLLDDQPGSS